MPTIFIKDYNTEVDFPDTMKPEEIQTVLAKKFPAKMSTGDVARGVGAIASGLVNWIPQGLVKAGGAALEMAGVPDALKTAEEQAALIQNYWTPDQTVNSQKIVVPVSAPFEWLSKKSQEAGDYVYDKTGSPILATGARVAGESIPFVAPVGIGKGIKSVRGNLRSLDQLRGLVGEQRPSIAPSEAAVDFANVFNKEQVPQQPMVEKTPVPTPQEAVQAETPIEVNIQGIADNIYKDNKKVNELSVQKLNALQKDMDNNPELYKNKYDDAQHLYNIITDRMEEAPKQAEIVEPNQSLKGKLTDNEQKAVEVGNNQTELRKRLNDSVSVLTDRKVFKDATFDYENKRLISKDGNYALQWKTRPKPDKPESYENQQTSKGTVEVVKLKQGEKATLYSNPLPQLLNQYTKYIGTPVWDYVWNKSIPNVLEKVPMGKSVLRAMDTEYRGDLTNPKAFNELLDVTRNNQGIGRDYAIDIGNRLQSLKEGEQMQVGQFLRGETEALPSHLEKLGAEARDSLTILGKQAVDAGLLDEKTFFKNIGKYFPRLYESKEYTGLIQKFKEPMPNRMDMSRFQKRKDIPKEIREQMGEILTPGYPVAKGIVQLTHDVSLAKMFKGISENPAWAIGKDAAQIPDGFVKMGANKKLGVLNESYVHPEIARELNAIMEVKKPWESNLGKAYGAWKYGKVIMSPKTHMRNMMSNSIMAHLGGLPMYEQPYYLAKAIHAMKNKTQVFQDVSKNSNIFRTGWATSELRSLYDSTIGLKDMPAGSWSEGVPMLREALSKGKQAGSKMADIYQKEEQVFKMAKIIKNLDEGMDIKTAVADANKWLFDYSKVTHFQEKYRQSVLGAPFATFTVKALPRVMEAAVKTPWRFALPAAMIYGLEEWAQDIYGDTKEQANAKDKLRPDYMKGSTFGIPNFPRVPVNDEFGREYYLDLTYVLPWGDIGQSGNWGALPGSLRPLSHPLVNEAVQQMMNHDQFWKQPITKDSEIAGMSKPQQYMTDIGQRIAHAGQTFLPTPVIDASKLYAAATGNPDYRGREKPMATTLADVGLGLKMTPVDYNDQMRKFEAQNDPTRGKLAQEIKSKIIADTIRLKFEESKGRSGEKYQKNLEGYYEQLRGLGAKMQEQGENYQRAFPQ